MKSDGIRKDTLVALGGRDQTSEVGLQCWLIHKEVPADRRRRMTLAQTTAVKCADLRVTWEAKQLRLITAGMCNLRH